MTIALGTLLLLATMAPALPSQVRPDFSGDWILVAGSPTASKEQQVRQDAKSLTVGHGGEMHSVVYLLDGKENRRVTAGGVEITSRTTWEGDKLVIDRSDVYPTGVKRKISQIWFLDAASRLTIDFTDLGRGTEGTTTRRIYKKK